VADDPGAEDHDVTAAADQALDVSLRDPSGERFFDHDALFAVGTGSAVARSPKQVGVMPCEGVADSGVCFVKLVPRLLEPGDVIAQGRQRVRVRRCVTIATAVVIARRLISHNS